MYVVAVVVNALSVSMPTAASSSPSIVTVSMELILTRSRMFRMCACPLSLFVDDPMSPIDTVEPTIRFAACAVDRITRFTFSSAFATWYCLS